MGASSCKCDKEDIRPCQDVSQTIFPCSSSYHPDGIDTFAPQSAEFAALENRPAGALSVFDEQPSARPGRNVVNLPGGATYEGSWLGAEDEAGSKGGWSETPVSFTGRVKHGQGTLILADGMRYQGQFKYDQKSGYGTYSYPSGSTYSGQWSDNLQNGHGSENWADGSAFEGQFSAGEKHGWGRFMWGNGCLFEGEFERNDMHGEGSYAWSDGRMYSGQWCRNFMGPAGTMQWPDGRVYEGDFFEGRKHGEGTHWWPDGRSYRGQWRDGKQNGEGVARTVKGIECKGLWDDGKFIKWLNSSPAGVGDELRAPNLGLAELEMESIAPPRPEADCDSPASGGDERSRSSSRDRIRNSPMEPGVPDAGPPPPDSPDAPSRPPSPPSAPPSAPSSPPSPSSPASRHRSNSPPRSREGKNERSASHERHGGG